MISSFINFIANGLIYLFLRNAWSSFVYMPHFLSQIIFWQSILDLDLVISEHCSKNQKEEISSAELIRSYNQFGIHRNTLAESWDNSIFSVLLLYFFIFWYLISACLFYYPTGNSISYRICCSVFVSSEIVFSTHKISTGFFSLILSL